MEQFTIIIITVLLSVVASPFVTSMSNTTDFPLLSRSDWHAKSPKLTEPLKITPVPYVIIHHSYIPPACISRLECIAAMQEIQEMHQEKNGWNDIGYSFIIGGGEESLAFTGRGWKNTGAHAPHYNDKSIGICLIGDWREKLPPSNQLKTLQRLIEYGVKNGFIDAGYKLVGHRQVREGTECPGQRLLEELATWPHFDSTLRL